MQASLNTQKKRYLLHSLEIIAGSFLGVGAAKVTAVTRRMLLGPKRIPRVNVTHIYYL